MQPAKSFASDLVACLLGGGFAVIWPALGQQGRPVTPRAPKPQIQQRPAGVTHLRLLKRRLTTLALIPLALSLFAPGALAQEISEPPLDLQEQASSLLALQEQAISQLLTVQPRNPSALAWDDALPEAAQKLVSQLLEDPYEEI